VVFHFNKAHLSDSSIPMWVVKCKGETYYVHHMESSIGFKTKETPDNPHTKGSLKFRGNLEIQEKDGQTLAFLS
jgi:hypothetical protein